MEINQLNLPENVLNSKYWLLSCLKDLAMDIDIKAIIKATCFLWDDSKFVPDNYRKEYLESYINGFIIRLKDLKDDPGNYEDTIDLQELKSALNHIAEQKKQVDRWGLYDSSFFKIYLIISLYTTFILDEPIHPVGTLFPGGFKVKSYQGTYLCPVKDKQKDNPGAVCKFCIAVQETEM